MNRFMVACAAVVLAFIACACSRIEGTAVSAAPVIDTSCVSVYDGEGALADNGISAEALQADDAVMAAIKSVDIACIPSGLAYKVTYVTNGVDNVTIGFSTSFRQAEQSLNANPSGETRESGWIQFVSFDQLAQLKEESIDATFILEASKDGEPVPGDERRATLSLN